MRPFLPSFSPLSCLEGDNTNWARHGYLVQWGHYFYNKGLGDYSYTQQELSELVNRKLKIDFGTITDLIPVERGKSDRIWKLKIVGTKKTLTIGKELEIRRALSESHLYSSAFDVEKDGDKFVLKGKGWGHGVGLCQIGAAVMGEQGHPYDDILLFYYRGAQIKRLYD